jgi:hypothetical protein
MRTYKTRMFYSRLHWYHAVELFVDDKCVGDMTFVNVSERDAFIKEWSNLYE